MNNIYLYFHHIIGLGMQKATLFRSLSVTCYFFMFLDLYSHKYTRFFLFIIFIVHVSNENANKKTLNINSKDNDVGTHFLVNIFVCRIFSWNEQRTLRNICKIKKSKTKISVKSPMLNHLFTSLRIKYWKWEIVFYMNNSIILLCARWAAAPGEWTRLNNYCYLSFATINETARLKNNYSEWKFGL